MLSCWATIATWPGFFWKCADGAIPYTNFND